MSGEAGGAVGRVRRSGSALSTYFRFLITPPLPGGGLLLVGFLEGVLGWGLSMLFVRAPGLAPLGLVPSVVLTWVVLTGGIVFVGLRYAAPSVRYNRVWVVWGGLNLAATGINLLALADLLPGELVVYAYWQPWFVVFGIGYLVTAVLDPASPQIRREERVVYAASGLAAFGLLAVSTGPLAGFVIGNVFVLGALLQLAPIGFDVVADGALVVRRQ